MCLGTWIEGNLGRVSGKLDWALCVGVKHLKTRQSMLHDEKELLLRQFRKVIKLGGPVVCSAGKF